MTLQELISTKRYKNSNYIIQKVFDKYALKFKNKKEWVDINNKYTWNSQQHLVGYCLGTELEIVNLFNKRNPIDLVENVLTEVTSKDFNKDNTNYYKQKLLEL